MGYCASGYGNITFDVPQGTDAKVHQETLLNMTDWCDLFQEIYPEVSHRHTFSGDVSEIVFNVSSYDKYYEDVILEELEKVLPLCKDLCIEYTGEDDLHWRIRKSGDKLVVEEGAVYYGDIEYDRLMQICADYISQDMEGAGDGYVLRVLQSIAKDNEIRALGFGWLLGDKEA